MSRVGPLHGDVKYSVSAEKTGYVITPDPNNADVFRAFKLGEISVKVCDTAIHAVPSMTAICYCLITQQRCPRNVTLTVP